MENTPGIQNTKATFIPQKQNVNVKSKRYNNIFFTLSVIILLLALGAWAGLIVYNSTLEAQRDELENRLKIATENLIQEQLVKDLQNLEARLVATDKLLSDHKNISPVISLIENSTLTNTVRFDNLAVQTSEGVYVVSMDGEAKDFESLAYQNIVFEEEPFIRNVDFNSFSINEESGDVSFNVSFELDDDLISHRLIKLGNTLNEDEE